MKIKKLLFLSIFLMMTLLFIPNIVNAANNPYTDSNDIIYYLYDTTATVRGYNDTGTNENLVIPGNIEVDDKNYTVTEIEYTAFDNCESLKSVKIPETVTQISSNAFSNCTALTSIEIPKSVTTIEIDAFKNTPWLNEKISNSDDGFVVINNILIYADKVTGKITIPDTVNTITDNVFYNCTSLTGVTIPNSVTTIREKAFYNTSIKEITIPDSVTYIGEAAFKDCKLLETSIIGEGVRTIYHNAFCGCTSLKSVKLGSSIKEIKDNVFTGCISLEDIRIPESVETIGYYTFSNCTSLKNVTILNPKTTIGYDAFANCNESLTIYAHSGSEAEKYANRNLANTKFVEIYKVTVTPNDGVNIKLNNNIITSTITENLISGDSMEFEITVKDGYTIKYVKVNDVVQILNGNVLKLTDVTENKNIVIETEPIIVEVIETYKLILDANEGKFADGKSILEFEDVTKVKTSDIENPVKDGYTFKGFFTEKTGGKSFEEIMNSEAGIESDITFYAQWEKITTGGESGIPEREEQEGNNNTGTTDTDAENTNQGNTNSSIDNKVETGKNPQTSDGIMLYVLILSMSTVGIIITTKIRKIRQNH